MIDRAVKDAEIESTRCQRNVERGGGVAFWTNRLQQYVFELERAARVVRDRLEWLEERRLAELRRENDHG
jgi:hypothetical protein